MNLTKLQQALSNMIGWTRTGFAKIEQNKPNIRFGNFAANQSEVESAKQSAPSQQTIFDSWYRFSHNTSGTYPANASETSSWAFDSTTGTISNTTNSGTLIGMVSKEVYDNYVLEMKLSSTDVDDDVIGIVIAWYKDPETGKEYTLSAMRSPGGMTPLYSIVYNYYQGAGNGQKELAYGGYLVTYGNNSNGGFSHQDAGWQPNSPGWGGLAAFHGTDGSVRLRVERQGDVIRVKTSQFRAPNDVLDSTLLTVDLTSDPLLEKFRGPKSYGLMALSQASSKWEVTNFTNSKDGIYDLSTGQVWTNTGGGWSINPSLSLSQIAAPAMLVNPTTGKMFLMQNPEIIIQYSGALVPKA